MPGILLETLYSRHYVKPLPEPQLLYVLVKVQPLLEMSLTTDAPLNLALVVDRSTSMKGARLQHVKNAVHRIIDECAEQDIISLVTFSDSAEVLIPAQHPTDARGLKSQVNSIQADGATAIYSGLSAGIEQIEKNRHSRYVNHVVLITDGRTYGDEEDCLRLAGEAHALGVGISGMGIGEDWNDRFLDQLAQRTGGDSAYISSAEAVSRFLGDRIRSLATAYAERANLIVASAPSVSLESVIRTAPRATTFDANDQPIALGSLDGSVGAHFVIQFHINAANVESGEELFVGRVDISGEVLGSANRDERVVEDLFVEVTTENVSEEPPPELLDALSRLALYRLQDRAREALEAGDVAEATRKLEYLATRLFESGQEGLAQTAMLEAQTVAKTQHLSDQGAKQLKYGTRALFSLLGDDDG
jgi:Ca-activated chloride channel family protein